MDTSANNRFTVKAPIGILGGTFDPVHYGHLRPALEICEQLELDHVRLIPSKAPVHRPQPVAPLEQRIVWLQQVAEEHPQFVVDLREVERDSPSWMVVTLESLVTTFPDQPICLIVGMDAFLALDSWHRWESLFEFAHLIVSHRPNYTLPRQGAIAALLEARGATDAEVLRQLPQQQGGRILLHPVTQLEISATAIRKMVAAGSDPRFLLPDTMRASVLDCYRLEEKRC